MAETVYQYFIAALKVSPQDETSFRHASYLPNLFLTKWWSFQSQRTKGHKSCDKLAMLRWIVSCETKTCTAGCGSQALYKHVADSGHLQLTFPMVFFLWT